MQRSLKFVARAGLGLLLLSLAPAWADPRMTSSEIAAQSARLFKKDAEILALRAENPEIIFKHPSFVEHDAIQSLRYHEVWVENVGGHHREWDVLGGGVDVHFYSKTKRLELGKHLLTWNNSISFHNLMDESKLGSRLGRELGFSTALASSEFELSRKLLVKDHRAVPVYWVKVKARAVARSKYHYFSVRNLVLDARSGRVIFNFSNRKHENASAPRIEIRDGKSHIVRTKAHGDAVTSKEFIDKFKDYCQVISSHKDNPGEAVVLNPKQCDLVTDFSKADSSAKRALDNSNVILKYYLSEHSQYGYDDDRASTKPITSVVHLGLNYDNAYWDPDLEVLAYGDGANTSGGTHDYTTALDIAGHEFTHAIVSHTANFVGPGEPGAPNEAFADIFGVLISRYDNKFANWSIGAKLYDEDKDEKKDNDDSELALRSLSNPGKIKTSTTVGTQTVDVPFPSKYSERLAKDVETCDDDNDQCEVHANSTIWSHNAYLIDEGFQKLGYPSTKADKMVGDLFFVALAHRLHENSTMKESAQEVVSACVGIYTEAECNVVSAAFREAELL